MQSPDPSPPLPLQKAFGFQMGAQGWLRVRQHRQHPVSASPALFPSGSPSPFPGAPHPPDPALAVRVIPQEWLPSAPRCSSPRL